MSKTQVPLPPHQVCGLLSSLSFSSRSIAIRMQKELTAAEQAIVDKASQDLYRYERICTEHSAVLRADLEAFTKAYQEYATNSKNPTGFMSPREEFDRYIEDAEKVLKKDCKTALEYAAYTSSME